MSEKLTGKTQYRLDRKQKLISQVEIAGTAYDDSDPLDIRGRGYETYRDATVIDLQHLKELI